MSSKTVYITRYTPYTDDVEIDDTLFNIFADARLVLFGNDRFSDDAIARYGELRNRGDLTVDHGLTLLDGSSMVNVNTVTQNGGLQLGQSEADAPVVRNISGATWTLAAGAVIDGSAASQFRNLGNLDTSDGAVIKVDFYNRDGGVLNATGALSIQGAVARFFGSVQGAGSITADNAVFIGASIGVHAFSANSVRMLDHVTVSDAAFSTSALFLANANLELTGNDTFGAIPVTNSSLPDVTDIRGSGAIDVMGTTSIFTDSYTPGGYTLKLARDITLNNTGTVDLHGSTVFRGHITMSEANVELSGHILNKSGAFWNDASSSNSYSGTGSYVNLGTFTEYGAGVLDVAVVNDGLFDVSNYAGPYSPAATLTFGGAVSGAGTINVSGRLVEVAASVSSGQTVHFVSLPTNETTPYLYTPTLQIDDPRDFNAVISNFDQNGAKYEQIVVDAAGWLYRGFEAGAAGGSLIFSDGASEALLRLTGSYDPTQFHSAVSGSQTTITYG